MDLAAQSRVYACVSAGDEHPVVYRVQLQLKLKKKVSVCINRNFPQLQEPAEDTTLSLSLKGLSNVFSFVLFFLLPSSSSMTLVAPLAEEQLPLLPFYPYPPEDFVFQIVCCC